MISFVSILNNRTYHYLVLALAIVFSLICALSLRNLRFDYEFEAFFPNEDHELELYENYRKNFEADNEFVLVAIENNRGIFRKDFLKQIDSLTKCLSHLNYIDNVTSPTNLKIWSSGALGPIKMPALHFDDESFYRQDSSRIYNSNYLVGSFFPTNAKSLSIYIKTNEGLKKRQSDSLATLIKSTLNGFKFENTHYVGRIFAQQTYLENLQKEFVIFLALAFLVVIIFLWLTFRSVYGIIVPVSIVLVSILWTLGIMQLTGKPIDLMTVMLPTMIFIAGMSDVVHFFSKYFEELARGTERSKIYPLILKEVGFPTFLTLITTVVGFLSLLFSSIRPIRDFGIYTSVGVIIAFILSYTLLPSLLYFFTPKKLVAVHDNNNSYGTMRKGLFWIFRNQKTIVAISVLTILISIFGITKIRINNILLEDLTDKVKIKQDFNFFDKNYSGVRPLEIEVKLKKQNGSLLDYENITQIHKVHEFISKTFDAGFLISPASLITDLNATLYESAGGFPDKENYADLKKLFDQNKKSKEIKKFITPDGRTARISGKLRDIGSEKINALNEQLFNFIATQTDTTHLSFAITGAAHLVDRNNAYMVTNMTQGFIFSLIVIAILTFLLHRSWRMVLVFIIPNVVPLVIIAGLMGYMGIELKAATSLVFSIAFGIATDDTIHFISRLKIELAYGKSLLYAFKRTYFETGRPIIITTFILLGGFMSLMVSDFQSTFYFGFLICITVIVAVLADIFLLPVLLFMIYKKKDPS